MIYIVWGPPGYGKSYYATRWAIRELLKRRKKRTVLTNYPIFVKKKKKVISSFRWVPELVYEGITDAFIVIDESYRDVSCYNNKEFEGDQHTFYATNRHNNNDIVLIAQAPQRIVKSIREMCNEYIFVKNIAVPIWGRPLWFRAMSYNEEVDMTKVGKTQLYSSERFFFKKEVGDAYDTHFFRTSKDGIKMQNWFDYYCDEARQKRLIPISVKTEVEKAIMPPPPPIMKRRGILAYLGLKRIQNNKP